MLMVNANASPWMSFYEDDEKFLRILKRVFVITIIVGVVVPFLPVPELAREEREALPPRIAKIITQKRQKPPEPKIEKAVEPTQPEPAKTPKQEQAKPKPKPEPKPKQTVRERVSKVGLLALRGQLTELRDAPALKSITDRNKKLTRATEVKQKSVSSSIAKNINKDSGGIETKNLTRATLNSEIAEHQTAKVDSDIDNPQARASDELRTPKRSYEDLLLVLDRYKGALEILYSRELRKNPSLAGKVLFEFKIAPSGEVLSVKILESELRHPQLERKFLVKLRSVNFGAANVGVTTVSYPIEFSPS
jgi:TonB family protein